jgi:hypothetical protein
MLVKVSIHSEVQKFGRRPDKTRTETTSGLVLSTAENRALTAVQLLLTETDYKGNEKHVRMSGYSGDIPVLSIATAEYLNAYGVSKHVTARGKLEFSGAGRSVALRALEQLAARQHHMVYERKRDGKRTKEERTDALIALEQKGRQLKIAPNPILIDNIDRYYILKPADLYHSSDDVTARLIEYLCYQATRKQGKAAEDVITEQPETLAYKLRMEGQVANRQWGRVRKKMIQSYQLAKEQGYLLDYELNVPGVTVEANDVLYLNRQYFDEMRKGLPVNAAKSTRKLSKVYQICEQSPSGGPVSIGTP